jgi:tRNA G18 (ribose-2'-O)-methylase SpoU
MLQNDPRLALFHDLRKERDRRDDAAFVCEGAICVRRVLENAHFRVRTVLITPSQKEAFGDLLTTDALSERGTEVVEVSNEDMHTITGFNFHRGCLAAVDKPRIGPPDFSRLNERATVVFAETVSDPANLGALVRNCRSFGVDLLVYTSSSADPFSRRAVRTSMGNVFSIPLARVDDLGECLKAFTGHGASLFAATLGPRAIPLSEIPRTPWQGVVVGTEHTGLLPSTTALATHEVTIPMAKGSDSLNVAAASAVFLYQMTTATRADR